MYKTFLVILLLLISTKGYTQNFSITESYAYTHINIKDAEGKVLTDDDIPGAIMFFTLDGRENVAITLGEKPMWNGEIIYKDKGNKDNAIIYGYKFYQRVGKENVPITLLQLFDLEVNMTVPNNFVILVENAYSGETVQVVMFTGIKKVR